MNADPSLVPPERLPAEYLPSEYLPSEYLPSEARRIVERWDPEGLEAWLTCEPAGRAVQVVAVRGIDAAPVQEALAAFGEVTPPVFGKVTPPAGGAAVVVSVLDSMSVLGRDELAALDAAAAATERVVVVLTAGGGSGREAVRKRDEALLRAHSGRFTDIRVLDAGEELAATVRAALAVDPATTARRNALRATHSLVTRCRRRIAETAGTLRAGGDAAKTELRARRARLAAERDGGRGERTARLRADIQRARVDLLHEVGVRVRSSATAARSDIDRADRRDLRKLPDRLARLTETAVAELDAVVASRLAEIVDHAGLPGSAVSGSVLPAPRPPDPEPRHRGVEDRLVVLVGASAGVGLGRLAVAPVAMVPALEIASVPITLALGGTAAWWIARSRRLVAERAHLRQWVADSTAHLRAQLEQRVHSRILEVEAEVSAGILAQSRAAAFEVDDRLAALDVEARRLASEHAGRLASCERDDAALASVLETLAVALHAPDADSGEPPGRVVRPIP